MADIAKQTAAALLEYEQLGRLTDTTREDLTKAITPDETPDDDGQADEADKADETKAPASKAAGTSKGTHK